MANRHVWSAAFFTAAVVVILTAVTQALSEHPASWTAAPVIVMFCVAGVLFAASGFMLFVARRSRPRLEFGDPNPSPVLEKSRYHFVRTTVLNKPKWHGDDTAEKVWAELKFYDAVGKSLVDYPFWGRWPGTGELGTYGEAQEPPTCEIEAGERFRILDIACQEIGYPTLFAHNDRVKAEDLKVLPLGEGPVTVIITLHFGRESMTRTFTITSGANKAAPLLERL